MATVKPPLAPSGSLRAKFATNLRAIRTRQGMTQIELATETGIAQAWLSRLERGQRVPDLDQIAVIADALGVSPTRLIR